LFRVAGVGSIYSLTNVGVTRSSNSIRYDSASMNGFSVAVLYGLGDTGLGNVSTDTPLTPPLTGSNPSNLGRQVGFNAMYNNGPLMLGVGWNRLDLPAITPVLNTFDDQKTTSFTASYDFKVVAINAGWQNNKITDNLQDRNTWNIGATIPVFGADSVKVSYADRHDKLVNSADVKLLALGYVHPMSPRTTLFGTYAKLRNDNNSAQNFIFGVPGTNVVGGYGPNSVQVGMSHNF
jgi:predicted porin